MVSGVSYWPRLSYCTRTSHDRAVYCLTRAPGQSSGSVLGGALSNVNQHSESFEYPSHHTVPGIPYFINNTEHEQNAIQILDSSKASSANTRTFVTAGATPRIDRPTHDIWVCKISNHNHSWNVAISYGRNQSSSSLSPPLRIKAFILVLCWPIFWTTHR